MGAAPVLSDLKRLAAVYGCMDGLLPGYSWTAASGPHARNPFSKCRTLAAELLGLSALCPVLVSLSGDGSSPSLGNA